MNRLYQLLNSSILLFAVTLTSCGYVSDKPPVNSDLYKSEELQSCKIDATKLSEIFTADQKDQIRCLQENFIQFTKYVRSKNPGSVSESELNVFVRKFFEGQSETIVKGLSIIFQLNMLLLKDEADRISKNNITPLFDLLVKVNQEAITITDVLKEMDDDKNQARFWELRNKFNASVKSFTDFTLKIVANSPGIQQKLNIKAFILEAGNKLGSKELNPDTVDSLVFLKRILVGGDKDIITSDELKAILADLPQILSMSFDLYYSKASNFQNDIEHTRYYIQNVKTLYTLIKFDQNDFPLFTVDQILTLANSALTDVDTKKFKPSIMAIKRRLIDTQKLPQVVPDSEKENITLVDLKTVLDMVDDFFERSYFQQVTYNAYQAELEKNNPIWTLPKLKLPKEYDLFTDKQIASYHADFIDVTANIRYFLSEKEGIPYYGTTLKRNKQGFLKATYMKWASIKLLTGYGHKDTLGKLQVSENEFGIFLNEMKPILQEFHLWSPTPETFARNSIYLADLFQNNSNGDLQVNVTEASEYVQMILSAVEVSDKFRGKLSTYCDTGVNKEDPIYGTVCFNQNFFKTVLDDLDYKRFFPKLNDYVKSAPASETLEYLKGVEGFARDIDDPKLPIDKRDNILIIGAMLNIESTFLRFDINHDNIIDYKELVEAFKIYQPAIMTLAHLQKGDESLALSVFLYMVSKMQIPPTGDWKKDLQFGAYHACLQVELCRVKVLDTIEAKRLNIGKLLYYTVTQPTTVAGKDKLPSQPVNE